MPDRALLLIDSAPAIYVLENHPKLARRFLPIFEAHAAGRLRFAITAISIAEILTGPLKSGDEALVRKYRSVFETWRVVALDAAIAESTARFRASLGLKLADAVQAASALSINATALVTHDRDFSRVGALRVIS